nr:hypothetical protein [uncultured Cohaesibacter sp.]
MLTEQSRIVAFVTGGLHNPFYSRVLEEFIIRLQDIGCQVMAFHVNGDDTLDAVAPKLSGYRVDAIVSALSVLTDAALEQFTTLGVPLISFNTHLQKKGLYSISSDNFLAGQLAARHLFEQGRRACGIPRRAGQQSSQYRPLPRLYGRGREVWQDPHRFE